jgi:FMN phosphatase YigB (HAD superfamily)
MAGGKSAKMNVPHIVVFDLGKVLVDFDYSIGARKIASKSSVPAIELQRAIDHSPLLFRLETGQISPPQFFAEVKAFTGYRGDFEEFSTYFADIFTPIPEMVLLHSMLRADGVPTFIFSNTNDLAVRHIRKSFSFFSTFTDYILSYEHGAMKPDARLYEVVERKTGRCGAEILYLDDRAENVEAGAQRGWQVILQESPEKTLIAVRKLGLLDHEPN